MIPFQDHADKFAKYAAQHIGYPIMDIELQDINFYTAFEAAVIEYSNQVNQVNIVNNLVNTIGIQTGSSFMSDDGLLEQLLEIHLDILLNYQKHMVLKQNLEEILNGILHQLI
jgi:hypothetical protein